MYDEIVGQIVWKKIWWLKLGGQIAWKSLVEEFFQKIWLSYCVENWVETLF